MPLLTRGTAGLCSNCCAVAPRRCSCSTAWRQRTRSRAPLHSRPSSALPLRSRPRNQAPRAPADRLCLTCQTSLRHVTSCCPARARGGGGQVVCQQAPSEGVHAAGGVSAAGCQECPQAQAKSGGGTRAILGPRSLAPVTPGAHAPGTKRAVSTSRASLASSSWGNARVPSHGARRASESVVMFKNEELIQTGVSALEYLKLVKGTGGEHGRDHLLLAAGGTERCLCAPSLLRSHCPGDV